MTPKMMLPSAGQLMWLWVTNVYQRVDSNFGVGHQELIRDVFAVILIHSTILNSIRVSASTGQLKTLAPPIQHYYLGGRSEYHHWACCNNCNDPSNTCDAVTWQGGSSQSYCSNCGRNTGGGRIKYYFNCGSVKTIAVAQFETLPGLCWQWLDCFKECCIRNSGESSRKKRQIDMTI